MKRQSIMDTYKELKAQKGPLNSGHKTVKVKDLKVGDQLGNSEIISAPVFIGDYCGSKNQMRLKVRYANGTESIRYWGQNTTIKIYV